MNSNIKTTHGLIIGLIVFAVVSRLIPHEYNFSPFGAIALFSAAYFANRVNGIAITVLASWVSSVILNNFVYTGQYENFVLFDENIFWQCLSYILIIFIGRKLFASGISPLKVLGGAFLSSIIFFILTNLGFWYAALVHPRTLDGLMLCFRDAIPFYRATLTGDVIYAAALFGSYYWITNQWGKKAWVNS